MPDGRTDGRTDGRVVRACERAGEQACGGVESGKKADEEQAGGLLARQPNERTNGGRAKGTAQAKEQTDRQTEALSAISTFSALPLAGSLDFSISFTSTRTYVGYAVSLLRRTD